MFKFYRKNTTLARSSFLTTAGNQTELKVKYFTDVLKKENSHAKLLKQLAIFFNFKSIYKTNIFFFNDHNNIHQVYAVNKIIPEGILSCHGHRRKISKNENIHC